jgi:glycosyltransferase involved in cell wall biosynthesis/SAM-dependent methyltransferase
VLDNTGERLLPWDFQYPQNHYEHLQRYYFASQFAAGCSVLDLGSGEGYGADILAAVAQETTGVDVSPETVEWANQKYKRSNLKFICGSATNVPIPGESIFDLVVCFEMIEHIADQEALLREVKRLLKPGGTFILSTPNKTVYSDEPHYQNPFHVRELYIPQFKQLIESFFQHSFYIGQRVHPSAAMWPLEGNAVGAHEMIVERRGDAFVPVEATRRSAMYIVALASGRPFSADIQSKLSSYFFLVDISDALVKRLCEDFEVSIRNTEGKYAQSLKEAKEYAVSLVAEAQHHAAQLRHSQSKISEYETRIAQMDTALNDLYTTLNQQRMRLGLLKGDLETLYNSRSWKLTGWLRKLDQIKRYLSGCIRFLPASVWQQRSLKSIAKLRSIGKLHASGLFDKSFYLDTNPDVRNANVEPLIHYLVVGDAEGRDPNPVFSSSFYLQRNPDIARAGINPLSHYLKWGWIEGRDPNPLFSTSFYLRSNPDVARAGLNPLSHFLKWGWAEGRDPHPLFGTSFYLKNNPDVAQAGVNPLVHFLRYSGTQRRSPHALFDADYYLAQNPDVARAGLNPLLHYLTEGAYQERDPHPHFDSSYYLGQNGDVARMGLNPLTHYVAVGIAEGRDPNSYFDTSWYLEEHAEVALKGLNPLQHWIDSGADREAARAPASASFDLCASLRNEFKESGRPLMNGAHGSPLVSTIISCSDDARFIEVAVLSSLLTCSHPMEIFVIIGESVDLESVALVDEIARKYSLTVIHEPHAGGACARSVGIKKVRGEFVQFLDADDLLASGKIDIQIDECRANPEADICVSEYEFCDAKGIERWLSKPSTIDGFSFSLGDFTSRWKKNFFIPIHCALFRRALLNKIDFDGVNKMSKEDPDQTFWINVSKLSPRFKFNPAVLASCRTGHIAVSPERPLSARITSAGGDRPTVSVIVPCYNQGPYLDEAIESVLEQSFQDFEIIIVDDGSTDEQTIQLIKNYRRPKTTVLRTTNQGLASARNNAIKESSGKYILPLDADDKIASTYLEKAVSILDANNKVGIVYCKADLFGDASGPWDLPDYRFPDILVGNRIFCSAFFRRMDWVRVNGYRPMWGWEDFDFWLSLIDLGREVFCIPDTLFFYRKRSDSMIATMSWEHRIDGFAQLFRNHPKLYMDNVATLLAERPALWLELERFFRGLGSLRDERLKLAWNVIQHLIAKVESSSPEPKTKHATQL